MELSSDGKKAVCPYCGHEMLIEKEENARREYERRLAKARAEEDIKDLQQKRQRIRCLKGWLTALCVLAGIFLICALVPGSTMHEEIFPRAIDPFPAVSVSFYGMSGSGKAEVELKNGDDAEFLSQASFELVPEEGLSNGDNVTVKAKAGSGWRFEPDEKQFEVRGLTEWVQSTEQLTGDNLALIRANTERLIREDWEEIASSHFVDDIAVTPYKMYLFLSDKKTSYEYNVLYDAWEVTVTRSDGSKLTTWEACRYTDLKLPADGVLTAQYGNLQGFNFGYNYGFSYAHSFAGWTDASEMEADLRYVRDGYHLAD